MMRETLKRITDARLILVSLRDSVGIMSSLGRTDEAQDMIEMMPSFGHSYPSEGLLARGDKAGAIEIVERLKTELTEFKSGQFPAQVHAEVAVVFAQFGLLNQSENALYRSSSNCFWEHHCGIRWHGATRRRRREAYGIEIFVRF